MTMGVYSSRRSGSEQLRFGPNSVNFFSFLLIERLPAREIVYCELKVEADIPPKEFPSVFVVGATDIKITGSSE